MKSKRNRIIILIVGIIMAISALAVVRFSGIGFKCPTYGLLGIYCPGCGITRMVVAISRGKLYQAFRYNPLVFILLPFIALYAVFSAVAYVSGKPNKLNGKMPVWLFVVLVTVIIAFGILRNFPMFSFLAPTNV